MAGTVLLQVLVIFFVLKSVFTVFSFDEDKTRIELLDGNPPSLTAEWLDSQRTGASSYDVTLTLKGSIIPNQGNPTTKQTTTDLLVTFKDLMFGANYTIEVVRKSGNGKSTLDIGTPDKVTPHITNNRVFIPMIAVASLKSTKLIGYEFNGTGESYPVNSGKVYQYYSLLSKSVRVEIGTNSTSGNTTIYTNSPLVANRKYIFTQVFEMDDGSVHSYAWSDPMTAPSGTTTKKTNVNSEELVGIIVGITAMIVGLVFIIICCFNWKYSLRYRPQPKKGGKPLERLVTDPEIPVTEDDFFDHVCQMKLHNFKGFYEEFSSIKKNEFRLAEAFGEPDNLHKNRFINIPCYDDSRVKLEGTTNVDTYIHANYVPGAYVDNEYIYAQSPLPETVSDFWAMVWQQGSDIIVMIGNLIEKGKQECAAYFPTSENPTLSSYCEIKLNDTHDTVDYTIRKLSLCRDGEVRNLTHYQYHGWPVNKMTPEYPTSFLRMIMRISRGIVERPGNRIIVHGTNDRHGRAGVYITVDSQVQRFLQRGDLSVFGSVVACTKHRHDGVKTLDEYIFIHDAVCEAVMLKNVSAVKVDALPKYIATAAKGDEGKDLFVTEFDFLTSASMSSTQKMAVGSQMCNLSKNRYSNIKPYDYNRVKLKKLKNQEGSDYINASYIDTYTRKRPFIATQAPLVETTADFWRMIHENKSWVIVMLGQEIEGGQLKANRFWPEEGHMMEVDELWVKFISLQQDAIPDVWIRQMELMDKQGERKHIQFYQYQEWPSQKAINSQNIRSLVQLMDQSEVWKEKLEAEHVVVISSSGIGRAGVFIALASLQEEANTESSVDVFRIVQQLNQQRSSLVQTREEYSLIYTATLQITEDARRRPVIGEHRTEDVPAKPSDDEPEDVPSKPSEDEPAKRGSKKGGVKFQDDEPEETTGADEAKPEGEVKLPLQRVNTTTNTSKM